MQVYTRKKEETSSIAHQWTRISQCFHRLAVVRQILRNHQLCVKVDTREFVHLMKWVKVYRGNKLDVRTNLQVSRGKCDKYFDFLNRAASTEPAPLTKSRWSTMRPGALSEKTAANNEQWSVMEIWCFERHCIVETERYKRLNHTVKLLSGEYLHDL